MDNKKIIRMCPEDTFSLFQDEEGVCIGGAEYLTYDWKWCLVGNIVREREYGENHEIKIGTKHFSPGTKIYCAPGHWGDGYENILVIGKQRGSSKYIEIVMPRRFIENFRCQKVFKPAVLRLMNKSRWGFWSNSDSDKETITKMAEGLNNPTLLLLPDDSDMDSEGIKTLRKMQSISEINGNNNLSLDEINEEIRAARLDGDKQLP